jgi:hypothetical protein
MEEYFKQNSVKPIRYPPSVRSADVKKENKSTDNGIGKFGQSSRDSVIDFIRYIHGHKIRKKVFGGRLLISRLVDI